MQLAPLSDDDIVPCASRVHHAPPCQAPLLHSRARQDDPCSHGSQGDGVGGSFRRGRGCAVEWQREHRRLEAISICLCLRACGRQLCHLHLPQGNPTQARAMCLGRRGVEIERSGSRHAADPSMPPVHTLSTASLAAQCQRKRSTRPSGSGAVGAESPPRATVGIPSGTQPASTSAHSSAENMRLK